MQRDLEDLLEDVNNDFKRRNAVRELAWVIDRRAAKALIKAIQIDDDPKLLEPTREGLKRMGLEVVDIVIDALADQKTDVRELAAEVLGEIKDDSAVAPLINLLLNDDEEFVRQAAVEALGNIGNKQALDPIIACLSDQSKFLRWEAAEALGKIGDTKAIEPLVKLLDDGEKQVSAAAQQSLKTLGYSPKS